MLVFYTSWLNKWNNNSEATVNQRQIQFRRYYSIRSANSAECAGRTMACVAYKSLLFFNFPQCLVGYILQTFIVTVRQRLVANRHLETIRNYSRHIQNSINVSHIFQILYALSTHVIPSVVGKHSGAIRLPAFYSIK